MQKVLRLGYERVVMSLYAHNLIVALPLTILFIKLLVRFFTREPSKDLFRSVLTLPLDLVYIAFGILLSAMAGRIPSFAARYSNEKEATFAGIILCLELFAAACVITWLDRSVRLLWQKFFSAWSLVKQIQGTTAAQLQLPGTPSIQKITVVYVWIFIYWILMVPLVFIQAAISVESLGGILKRLQ